MVEVFKTNVTDRNHAKHLVEVIRYHFTDYKVNFDLEDCDRILRIESTTEIEPDRVVELLKHLDVTAEILIDEPFLLIIS
jgi:hypothetical protein